MTIVFTVLTLAVLGVVAAVAVGRIGGGLDEAASSLPSRGFVDGTGGVPLAPEQLDELRFSPALRGYRPDEVDLVLDRLAAELRLRDAQIQRLRTELALVDPLRADEDVPRQDFAVRPGFAGQQGFGVGPADEVRAEER